MNFNRRVRSMDGDWTMAPPEDFKVECWSGTVTGPEPSRTNVCDRYINISFKEGSIDLKFTAPVRCCGGGGEAVVPAAPADDGSFTAAATALLAVAGPVLLPRLRVLLPQSEQRVSPALTAL